MKSEQAKQLGRQAAELDVADRIINEQGNIIDEETLKEHLRYQIENRIHTSDLPIEELRTILDICEGVENDHIFASSVVYDRIIARYKSEFAPDSGSAKPRRVAPDEGSPLNEAREGYVRFVLNLAKGIRN